MSIVTRTLRSLPFGRIIGGPMTAAIEAQALAARSTIDFIKSVGFIPPSGAAADDPELHCRGGIGRLDNP